MPKNLNSDYRRYPYFDDCHPTGLLLSVQFKVSLHTTFIISGCWGTCCDPMYGLLSGL
jgi:hypothetical protein